MAVVINTTLEADTKEAQRQVGKLKKEVEKVGQAAKKSGEEISAAMQIGNEATRALDKVSGGLASKLVKVAKAAKLSGKAMKTALISSGIGAAVVAIGLLVEYWDDIVDFVSDTNKELEKQIVLNNQNLDAVDLKLRNLKSQIELEKRQGKNADELIEKEKALIKEKRDTLLKSIEDEKSALRKLEIETETLTIAERIRQGKKGISEITEEENEALIKQRKILSDLENKYTEFESSLLDPVKKVEAAGETDAEKLAEQQRQKAIDDKAKSIEEITKLEDEFLQSQLEKQTQEENAVYDKYFTLIEEAKKYKLKTTLLEEARQKELQVISDTYAEEAKDKEKKRLEDIQKIVNDATDLSEIQKLEREKASALAELDLLEATWIEKARIAAYYENQIAGVVKENKEEEEKDEAIKRNAQLDMAKNTLGDISTLFDEQSAASKAAAAAAALINTYQGITAELATKTVTPFEFGLKIANIATTAAIGFKSVKDILKTSPSNARGGTNPASGASGGLQAPAFNVVGASGETQLADAIGSQTQRPSRAYVVSNDVTTAQELDRNIIEGASIG